jgi:hypothetical protein
MREGPIADPERRKELEGYLEQSLINYGNLQIAMRETMAEAVRQGDQEEIARQARRAAAWRREAAAPDAAGTAVLIRSARPAMQGPIPLNDLHE